MKKVFLVASFLVLTVFTKIFAQSSCPAITSLTVSNITNTSATFNWVAGPFNYYNTYDFYAVEYKPSNTNVWIWFGGGTPMQQTMSVFSPGTSYDVRVSGQYTYSLSTCPPSAVLTFTTTGSVPPPPPPVYCATTGLSTSNGWIKSVKIGTINNVSGNNSGYANFTTFSTNVIGNTQIPLTVKAGAKKTPKNQYWVVYVDLNNDGDFLDANETITNFSTSGGTAFTKNIVIPTTTIGSYRMRIKAYSQGNANSCGTFANGEVEDYTIKITSNSSARIASNLPVVLVNETLGNQLTIYPNPAADQLTVSYFGEEVKDLKIFDMTGKMIIEDVNFSNIKKLNISKLQKGMYVLQLTTKTGKKTQKFIKD